MGLDREQFGNNDFYILNKLKENNITLEKLRRF